MPKLINRNPSYRKHRHSGQAIVSIAGTDIYLGPFGSKASKVEYDRVIAEWLANGRRLPTATDDGLTIDELIARFWEHCEAFYRHADGSPTGEAENFRYALKVLRSLYTGTPAAAFGPLALEAVRGEMIRLGWCRNVCNSQTGRIRAMFRWAVSKELVPSSVHQSLMSIAALRKGKSAARETGKIRPVADATVDATIPHLSTVVAAMVRLQRATGMRPHEICIMRTADIDMSGPTWSYTPGHHKTEHHGDDHQRIVFIGPRGQEILRPFVAPLNPTAFCFRPSDAVAEMRQRRHAARTTPLSCGNRIGSNVTRKPKRKAGASYSVDAYRIAIRRACDAAFPVPNEFASDAEKARAWRKQNWWHPHQLRHTAATEIRKLHGIEAVRVSLGHSTLAASEVYAEVDQGVARAVAAATG